MSYAVAGSLAKALKFGGNGNDYLSLRYDGDIDVARVLVRDEVESVGARFAGKPLRLHVDNLLSMANAPVVVVDFEGIELISSSFADEALGKLALQLGLEEFQRRVSIANANETIVGLLGKAVRQRLENAPRV